MELNESVDLVEIVNPGMELNERVDLLERVDPWAMDLTSSRSLDQVQRVEYSTDQPAGLEMRLPTGASLT